jgi:DNA anti-recombination protein RmuC
MSESAIKLIDLLDSKGQGELSKLVEELDTSVSKLNDWVDKLVSEVEELEDSEEEEDVKFQDWRNRQDEIGSDLGVN